MQVTSAVFCKTREIEGVGTVGLVCVDRLFRMGGESVGCGFTGKGELDVWVVRPGNLHESRMVYLP